MFLLLFITSFICQRLSLYIKVAFGKQFTLLSNLQTESSLKECLCGFIGIVKLMNEKKSF